MKNPGRVARRLANLLQDAGVPIPDATRFWVQQGGYRHVGWDLARWGADWHADHQFWSVYSWCTMSACVRYGIVLDYDGPTDVEVFSKKSPEDFAREKQKLQDKIRENERRSKLKAAERQKLRQERFRVFRCSSCGAQFPWEWPAEKKCSCGSAAIRDVSADVLIGYDE